MDVGIPCKRTTLATKTLVIVAAVKRCFNTAKLTYFVKRSTITMMTVYPLKGGRPSIKSMEISNHIFIEIGKGWSKSADFMQSLLNLWKTSHSFKYFFKTRMHVNTSKNTHENHHTPPHATLEFLPINSSLPSQARRMPRFYNWQHYMAIVHQRTHHTAIPSFLSASDTRQQCLHVSALDRAIMS